MESGDERNSKAIDSSVGGLVWVRRRNGSWWPGRILNLDEAPETSLISPKSGTPIKLLGRDDASVDWYNLEKSKRVKAFRCGDYDACIEKAKAATANSCKKTARYARREDAIIHALEIENSHLSKHHPDLGIGKEKEADDHEDEPAVSLRAPAQKNGASKEKTVSEKRRKTPNDSEDDGTEGIKRMRGLEDLGNGTSVNGDAVLTPSSKRKRSQVINSIEHSRRKNRRRPLTKVLESTAMVSVPVTCDELASSDLSPHTDIGLESIESKKTLSAVVSYNSDSTGISCENDVTVNVSDNVYLNSQNKVKDGEISSISVLADNDSLFDVPLIGEEKQSAGLSAACSPSNGFACMSPAANNGIEKSASKWQLKGKRNSRQMSKKQEARRNAETDEQYSFMPHYGTRDRMRRNSQVCEVKIEVEANYKPRNYPMVSLMSKLNGKAVVGHPLTVEVLENGSCDDYVVRSRNGFETGKSKSSSRKKSKKKKSQIPQRKSSKAKKSSSLSKKTRRLSALTGNKLRERGKKRMKMPEKPKEAVIECVPLKVVFSRINEALKGSSARQAHRPANT